MRPTQILSDEHRVIETVLDALEAMTRQSLTEGKLDRRSALEMVDFIRNFADACHHGKEEAHLFPVMVGKGIPDGNGPIGAMRYEHEQGRALVRAMADSIDSAASGDRQALEVFAENAEGYIMLLRAHICKEDAVLFPMAMRIMNSQDDANLMTAFNTVETEHMGHGTHERYLSLAKTLAERFGISARNVNFASGGCGHIGHGQQRNRKTQKERML